MFLIRLGAPLASSRLIRLAICKAIEISLGQVWTAASKLAMASAETVRQEAQAAIDAASVERDEALAEINRLEERMADKDKTIELAQSELSKERAQSAKQASDNAALAVRVDDRGEKIKSLKAELKEARADNKALQGGLVEIARLASKKD